MSISASLQEVDDHARSCGPRELPSTVPPSLWISATNSGGHLDRRQSAGRVQSQVAVADAQHPPHAVVVGQLGVHGPNDVVQARAQAAAGHDGGRGLRRIEEHPFPRTGLLERQLQLFGRHLRTDLVVDTGRDRRVDERHVLDADGDRHSPSN